MSISLPQPKPFIIFPIGQSREPSLCSGCGVSLTEEDQREHNSLNSQTVKCHYCDKLIRNSRRSSII